MWLARSFLFTPNWIILHYPSCVSCMGSICQTAFVEQHLQQETEGFPRDDDVLSEKHLLFCAFKDKFLLSLKILFRFGFVLVSVFLKQDLSI